MTVKLVTNEKVAETSSKGNQEKWFDSDTNKWYKLDQFGYEALTETVISKLLEKSNIEAETPFSFVRYEIERLNVHGRDRTGCGSENFLRDGQSIITLSHLFSRQLGTSLKDKLEKLSSDKKRKAGADEFIRELKDGYDTYVGERGVKLSGGQKQRISIARVFLKNPPIIFLAEATSALDNESEYVVAESLSRLSEGRTTLTIAHRLSTIRNSDRILVLTENGIAEEGNHNELMEQKGIYYNFYQMANRLS